MDVPMLYLAWCAPVSLAIIVQGYLGGEMVFRFGMEVKGGYRRLPVTGVKTRRPRPTPPRRHVPSDPSPVLQAKEAAE